MIGRGPWSGMGAVTLLSGWLGAAVIVAGTVAPAAFVVLPTRTLAGALVGRILPVLFWSGMVVGAVVTAVGLIGRNRVAVAGGGALGVACAVAQLIVAPRIERLRDALGGPLDTLPPGDARRLAFGRLHGASVMLLAVAAVAALTALVVLLRSTVRRTT